MSNLKLAFVLEMIDKATAPLRKVGKAVDDLNEPARRVSRSWAELSYRFGRLQGMKLSRQWGEVESAGKRLSESGREVGQVLGAITLAAGGAFWAMKRTADEIDRASDQAKKLGMSVEMYQRMGYAAQLNGASQDEMGSALQFLSQNMVEAINGSKEAAQWFARVGIPLERLKKMNAGQAFEAIADKFQSVGDAGQNAEKKIAVMRALMGRSGAELRQTLDLGSEGLKRFYAEADRVGAVVSGETADAVGDFNDNFDRLKTSLFGVMAAITTAALPALDALVKQLTEISIASRAEWGAQIGEAISKIVTALPGFLKQFGAVLSTLAMLAGAANTVAQAIGGWDVVINIIAGVLALKLVVGIYSLGAALAGLVPIIWSVGAALMATPLGWFLAAIAAIVAAVYLVYRNWAPIKAFFVGLWDGVKAAFMAVYDWLMGKLNAVLGFVTKVVNAVKGVFSSDSGAGGEMEYDAMGNATGFKASSALPPGGAKTDVGGVLKIQIDSEGRARTTEAKNNNRDVDYEVYTGTTMVTP